MSPKSIGKVGKARAGSGRGGFWEVQRYRVLAKSPTGPSVGKFFYRAGLRMERIGEQIKAFGEFLRLVVIESRFDPLWRLGLQVIFRVAS